MKRFHSASICFWLIIILVGCATPIVGTTVCNVTITEENQATFHHEQELMKGVEDILKKCQYYHGKNLSLGQKTAIQMTLNYELRDVYKANLKHINKEQYNEAHPDAFKMLHGKFMKGVGMVVSFDEYEEGAQLIREYNEWVQTVCR